MKINLLIDKLYGLMHSQYCSTGFDSDSLTAAKIATKMVTIVGIRYRNYTHYTLYKSCLPIYEIAIIRSLSSLFLDDFEGNTNITVAIKSGATVVENTSNID